jgi:hypothetical protein
MRRTRKSVALLLTTAIALAGSAVVSGAIASAATTGAGIGSSAALSGPNCDPATKRVKIVYAYLPPCVAPYKKGADNGGATMQGVTKDTIKVVVYTGIPADQAPEDATVQGMGQLATNLSTGLPGTIENAVHDTTAAVGHPLETWGRTIEYEYITRTGTDDASERADAVNATAKKPFAVLDLASAEVFCSEVAARKVIAICATGTNKSMDAQKPYRYSTFIDYWANVIGTAELIGKGLKGKPAQWAGDATMKTQTRKFGSVYQTGQTGIDVDLWKSSLAKYRAPKFAAELGYDAGTGDPLGNSAISQEQAPVMIGKLKDAGATSVVLFTDITMTAALMTAANTQDYHPEWVETGFLFQDIGAIGRLFNKDQWAHAFGLGTLNVPVKGRAAGDPVLAWYWGRDNFSYNAGVLGEVVVLTFGIHLAGPKLTPDAFRTAVFGVGAQNGALADDPSQLMLARGKAPGIPYAEYLFGGDHPLIWWSNDAKPTPASATGTQQTGASMYMDDGTRYIQGKLPTGEPKFFDTSASVVELPAEVKPLKQYPCVDCPSSGGTQKPGAG